MPNAEKKKKLTLDQRQKTTKSLKENPRQVIHDIGFGCDSKAQVTTTKNQRVRELDFIKFLEYYVQDILVTE